MDFMSKAVANLHKIDSLINESAGTEREALLGARKELQELIVFTSQQPQRVLEEKILGYHEDSALDPTVKRTGDRSTIR
jgi:hypothetical protein